MTLVKTIRPSILQVTGVGYTVVVRRGEVMPRYLAETPAPEGPIVADPDGIADGTIC